MLLKSRTFVYYQTNWKPAISLISGRTQNSKHLVSIIYIYVNIYTYVLSIYDRNRTIIIIILLIGLRPRCRLYIIFNTCFAQSQLTRDVPDKYKTFSVHGSYKTDVIYCNRYLIYIMPVHLKYHEIRSGHLVVQCTYTLKLKTSHECERVCVCVINFANSL